MKKNMRKLLAVCLTALLVLTLVACGGSGDSKFVGDYDLISMSMGGLSLDAEAIKSTMPDAKVQLILREDGSFTLSSDLGDGSTPTVEDGKWKESGSDLKLTAGGSTVIGTVDGDTITLTEDDVTMSFQKAK